jgi:hypothetical protein
VRRFSPNEFPLIEETLAHEDSVAAVGGWPLAVGRPPLWPYQPVSGFGRRPWPVKTLTSFKPRLDKRGAFTPYSYEHMVESHIPSVFRHMTRFQQQFPIAFTVPNVSVNIYIQLARGEP